MSKNNDKCACGLPINDLNAKMLAFPIKILHLSLKKKTQFANFFKIIRTTHKTNPQSSQLNDLTDTSSLVTNTMEKMGSNANKDIEIIDDIVAIEQLLTSRVINGLVLTPILTL